MSFKSLLIILISLLILLQISFTKRLNYYTTNSGSTFNSVEEDYNYKNGGEDWDGLCKYNITQSPININDEEAIEYKSYFFYVSDIEIHTANINQTDSNQFNINGYFSRTFFINQAQNPYYYNMTSLHVHSPSEHKLNNRGFDLEIQFSGSYLNGKENTYNNHIISFFFNATSGNYTNKFIDSLISIETNKTAQQSLDVSQVLTEDLSNFKTYIYEGSLTTPPCTLSALWFIVTTPLQIGVDQLNYFKNKWENNPDFANGRGNNRNIKNFTDKIYSNGGEY